MKLRAIIFDVYQTVLEVSPPPTDRETRWRTLLREATGAEPGMTLATFASDADRVIAREHAAARLTGIPFPEIFWPDVALQVLPELGGLPAAARGELLWRQQALFRTVRLMPGAAETLRSVSGRGLLAGIASNAQPYTLRELDGALAGSGLGLGLFVPELCFWSFAHGFSKPDPHVFRLLTARLKMRGISGAETLMVGDRPDNDLEPARAHGWQTWQLATQPVSEPGGEWAACAKFILAHA